VRGDRQFKASLKFNKKLRLIEESEYEIEFYYFIYRVECDLNDKIHFELIIEDNEQYSYKLFDSDRSSAATQKRIEMASWKREKVNFFTQSSEHTVIRKCFFLIFLNNVK
jgi:hypothetical protein